ncbi:zinc-binding alcohol dehydrogenase family protein [Gordonia sp. PS3]|uniref:Probable alcohol dehydrogenase AdhA n=1 Tax=Gordonia sihwensis NBRC 108236 TaxID=1223544 RepID=L7LRM3_9ACTN|nr:MULTISPECIES: zinc-binding alcohol dehydrogenase family protein [Gordonia]AUH67798.1 zinc-binding alcohol dehydrogenase family protein [Gordonia sp. YC-JH1]KJR06894.1 alcohol dehydrogenase [Gordonia sihwensis]KXT58229.1 alcohol dehydrogenase [Gordonia sp. QH-12]MBY4568887.1 alcohol dehydrogenase [Gordonia sihwensis]WFN95052.1 zinc-binding alcohol dehydrogenase family protein [Gordonia sihwensis]
MRVWRVTDTGPVSTTSPIEWTREPVPTPSPGELLIRVDACGVCRTDLHVVEGDLPVHRPHVVPGHEVVGTVVEIAPGTTTEFRVNDRVGVPWLHSTCGRCVYCRRGAENLCPDSTYTGWDADGGYAEFAVVPAAYALRLPTGYSVDELAPLLCAGIIGFRALRRAELPPGGRLGLYGFGGSAHLVAQVAIHQGARVHVLTQAPHARRLAADLGAVSVGGAYDSPTEPLDAAIIFAPVGELIPTALEALDRGGILCLAGIHMSATPPLDYRRHLFHEKEIRSVEANTRDDAVAFLQFADDHRLQVTTRPYRLDEALHALRDLKAGRFAGAAVLHPAVEPEP